MWFIKILLYGLLAIALGSAGVFIAEQTFKYMVIIGIVVLIDISSNFFANNGDME